jgi:hypothetical protein
VSGVGMLALVGAQGGDDRGADLADRLQWN